MLFAQTVVMSVAGLLLCVVLAWLLDHAATLLFQSAEQTDSSLEEDGISA